ncbi:MAG: alanine:cation symporter family protein, partial [Gemmiger sp.]|nr:alanine:cation symporter family protein [Gemmiger sp.]
DSALSSFNVLPADAVKLVNLIIGVALAIIIALILIGGIKRIGNVTSKLVPFMAIMYIVLALGVIFFHIKSLPAVFASIIEGAFNPASVTGGVVGSFFMSMKKGVSRGIFSNEAGLGTGSIAHACADTKKPVKQGMFGIFEVFADTIVICTLTAMVILCSGTTVNYGTAAGAELTISGFTTTYGGWASIFTAVALCCFAFSTIIGWGLYGSRFIAFLCRSDKVVRPFFVVYSFVSILGATMDLGLMWSIADTFNGLMSIPNLIALLLLSGTVAQLTKEYFEKEKV